MPELSALEVLSAIAKTGSLSAASRELGISQQAVSARLTSIESQIGVRLVTRTTRGTQLTSAGEVVAEWADQVLDVAQRVDTGLASLRAERRSRLKVVASQTVAEQLLPRWLVSLQAAALRHGGIAPEVSFTATDSEGAITAVRDGEAELGFIEIRATLHGLRSRVIGRDELIVVVPPDHKWVRRSAPITVAELRHTPLVSRESGWRLLLGADEPFDGDQPSAAAHPLELASAAAVRAAVLAGAGPALMSRLAVSDDLIHGRLRASRIQGALVSLQGRGHYCDAIAGSTINAMNTSTTTNQVDCTTKITARTTPTGFRRRNMAGALLVMALTASAVGFAAISHADDTQIPGTDPTTAAPPAAAALPWPPPPPAP